MVPVRQMLLAAAIFFSEFAPVAAGAEGPFTGASTVAPEFAAGFANITESDAEATLRHLVEGEMSGRGTGQEGYLSAARWFASQLEANGFQPGGDDGSWFQNVPFIKLATLPERCGFNVGETQCVSAAELGISSFSGTFEGSVPVTFAIVTDKRPETDEGSCSGRLLLIQSKGRIGPDDAYILKAKPACVLIVSDEGRLRTEAVHQSEQTPSAIPAAVVTKSAANALATMCGMQAEFFADGNPEKILVTSSSQTVECRLTIERESIDVPNVVGWYPGSDESVRNEHICIGAHLDHLGIQRGDLFPGADDNGSGSAAVLQVARAIHANPVKPKRSILLIAFCAEERGLLGSKHYVANPLKPLEDMICMLNIDMIGRNEETDSEPATENENTIHLVGSKDHSRQLHEMVETANQHIGFVFEYDEEDRVDGRSDHASFSAKGIPVTFLFGGFNPHYHKPSDTMDGINFTKIANASRLNYLLLMMAAEHGRFVLDEKK